MTTRKTYQIVLRLEEAGNIITSTPYDSVFELKQAYNAFALCTDGVRLSIIQNTISRVASQDEISITEI